MNCKLDFINADGDISNYYPDFLVKLTDGMIVVVETKGQEDLDVPMKMARPQQWWEDINRVQTDVSYDLVFVEDEGFKKYHASPSRPCWKGSEFLQAGRLMRWLGPLCAIQCFY